MFFIFSENEYFLQKIRFCDFLKFKNLKSWKIIDRKNDYFHEKHVAINLSHDNKYSLSWNFEETDRKTTIFTEFTLTFSRKTGVFFHKFLDNFLVCLIFFEKTPDLDYSDQDDSSEIFFWFFQQFLKKLWCFEKKFWHKTPKMCFPYFTIIYIIYIYIWILLESENREIHPRSLKINVFWTKPVKMMGEKISKS